MLYHPTILSICCIAGLISVFRYDKIFKAIAIIFPLFIAYNLYYLEGSYSYKIMNMEVIANYESYTIPVAYAFTAIILFANIYSAGNHKKLEIVLGSTYGALTYLALFAGDMLSLIVSLELMMIVSSFMIFAGGNRRSIRSSKKYFLTHLMSGNMIIIGICYLIMKTGSAEILNLAEFVDNPEYSTFIIAIMLTGLVMNIAAFPFSGWMVNYYPDTSPSGFVYLISFTTKVSVIILLKFFAGCELLKYVAIIMIIYASIKAVLENNLFSLLCLLSIMQIGFMVIIISLAGHNYTAESIMVNALASYLFLHILYKGLLSLSVAAIVDHGKIVTCNDIKRIKNPTILFALIVGIAAMINAPLTSTFTIKTYITHLFVGDPIYFVITFLSMMTAIALPWYRYIKSHETVTLHLNFTTKFAIYCSAITVLITTFFADKLPYISKILLANEIMLFSADSMKQLTIIGAAIAVALFLKRSRTTSYSLNLTEAMGDILFFLYYYFDKKGKNHQEEEKEPLMLDITGKQLISKIQILHNQQTAIFIVFSIFIVLLVSFITHV